MIVAPLAGLAVGPHPGGAARRDRHGDLDRRAAADRVRCPPTRAISTSPGGWRCAARGSALFLPPNARLIIGSAPRERAAAAGGLVSTVRLVGQTTGATLVAALLALGVGGGRVPPLVAAGLALVAGLCSLARLRPSIRNPAARGSRATSQPASGALSGEPPEPVARTAPVTAGTSLPERPACPISRRATAPTSTSRIGAGAGPSS